MRLSLAAFVTCDYVFTDSDGGARPILLTPGGLPKMKRLTATAKDTSGQERHWPLGPCDKGMRL